MASHAKEVVHLIHTCFSFGRGMNSACLSVLILASVCCFFCSVSVAEEDDSQRLKVRFARAASPIRWGKRAAQDILRWGKREPLRWGKRSAENVLDEDGGVDEGQSLHRFVRESPLRYRLH